MQTTITRHDARCKQRYECHIQILHIFLINFHIKYFLFRVTVWKIWILQDLDTCSNFQQNRENLGLLSPRCSLARVADRRGLAVSGQGYKYQKKGCCFTHGIGLELWTCILNGRNRPPGLLIEVDAVQACDYLIWAFKVAPWQLGSGRRRRSSARRMGRRSTRRGCRMQYCAETRMRA
jgi:hypothetical protein